MTPKEKANEIFSKMHNEVYESYGTEIGFIAKQCALIAVNEIINCNPHSNPLNTEVYSTMEWWLEVKQQLKNL
jgi:hypothetical protein